LGNFDCSANHSNFLWQKLTQPTPRQRTNPQYPAYVTSADKLIELSIWIAINRQIVKGTAVGLFSRSISGKACSRQRRQAAREEQ